MVGKFKVPLPMCGEKNNYRSDQYEEEVISEAFASTLQTWCLPKALQSPAIRFVNWGLYSRNWVTYVKVWVGGVNLSYLTIGFKRVV